MNLLGHVLHKVHVGISHDAGVGAAVVAGNLAARDVFHIAFELDERRATRLDDIDLAPCTRAMAPQHELAVILPLVPIVQRHHVRPTLIDKPQVQHLGRGKNLVYTIVVCDLAVFSAHASLPLIGVPIVAASQALPIIRPSRLFFSSESGMRGLLLK